MPFLTGKQVESSPKDTQAFRSQLFDFIRQQGLGTAITGSPAIPAAYGPMFAQHRAEALAAAKESAGNLTGSGFANVLGAAAGRSAYDENAFLANLQQQSADRFLRLLQLPAAYTGQMSHQPGLLDYAFQGAQAAAPFFLRAPSTSALPGAPDVSGFDPSGLSRIGLWTPTQTVTDYGQGRMF